MSHELPRSGCIFCKICDDTSKEGLDKLLYSDDNIVVFRDIYPAAKHHFLVVPREHIPNPKCLTKDQKPFVEQMISIARQTMEKEGADMSDIRLGFHWPPFHSVKHLHLHAISPTNDMSFIKRIIFRENSWWFVSPDYVLQQLSSGL